MKFRGNFLNIRILSISIIACFMLKVATGGFKFSSLLYTGTLKNCVPRNFRWHFPAANPRPLQQRSSWPQSRTFQLSELHSSIILPRCLKTADSASRLSKLLGTSIQTEHLKFNLRLNSADIHLKTFFWVYADMWAMFDNVWKVWKRKYTFSKRMC